MRADAHAIDWSVAIHRSQASIVNDLGIQPEYVADLRPARSRQCARELIALEESLRPDVVLTLCGPAYCRFRAPHLMGWTDGWTSHATRQAYRAVGWKQSGYIALANAYKRQWAVKADHWIAETITAKEGLALRCGIPMEGITVIENTCLPAYWRGPRSREIGDSDRVSILVFAAPWKHKRIDLVPLVARELLRKRLGCEFEFVLTLPNESKLWQHVESTSRTQC